LLFAHWIQKEKEILQQPSETQPPVTPKRANIGFVISLVAAVLILAQGIVRIFRGEAIAFLGSEGLRRRVFAGLTVQVVGAIAIVFAILILVGAFLIYSPGKETIGGIIVLVFAVLSILTGGGWLAGLILGIVGGVLGLIKK
jgi:hypothetical protein